MRQSSNILVFRGGANVGNLDMNRGMPSLRWMVFEAGAVGLRTALFERNLSSSGYLNIQESLKGPWWLFEMLPFKRLTFTTQKDGKQKTCR